MNNKVRAGGEIDAYCTKCKMDLNHRIVAMVGETVKQVECLTCRGTHAYRKTKAQKEADEKRKEIRAEARGTTLKPPRTTAAARASSAARSQREALHSWEKSIAGQPSTAFRSYKLTEIYTAGELVRHTKFGDGVISQIIDRSKVLVLFQEGPRTLAQGLTA